MTRKILNNKFIKSTLLLLIGGTMSKILGFVLKIIITRAIKTEGIGIYSLLSPTISFFTTIAIFSYPTAISKLISEGKSRSKKIILSIIPVSLLINFFMIIIIYLLAPFISNILLKEEKLYYPIICIGFTLPFISLSSIIKGYFWGKQKMMPYILSNIVEQIVRIIILSILVPKVIKKSIILTICLIISVNIISETSSIIVMIKGLPKNNKISKKDLRISKHEVKEIFNISLPSTGSKLIGSCFYFLEPIIITNLFLYLGYTKDYIIAEYGILNGYSLSLLLLPGFFSSSISTALIPELSKNYASHNNKLCIKRIKQISLLSLSIGLFFTGIIFIFREELLMFLFNTKYGSNYIISLAPFTLLFYLEVPFVNSLQALGKAKECAKITIVTEIIRTFSIIFFSLFKIGMYSLSIAISINLTLSTSLYFLTLKKVFK